MSRWDQMAYGRKTKGAKPKVDSPDALRVATHREVKPDAFRTYEFDAKQGGTAAGSPGTGSIAGAPSAGSDGGEGLLPHGPIALQNQTEQRRDRRRSTNWRTHYWKTDASLASAPVVTKTGAARVTYEQPIAYTGEREGTFTTRDRGAAARIVISSILDRAMRTNALNAEAFAEHYDAASRTTRLGTVSAKTKATSLVQRTEQTRFVNILDDTGELHVSQSARTDVDFASAAIQKGLANLQVIDFLAGVSERDGASILAGAGEVTANAMASSFPATFSGSKLGMPPLVDRQVATAILDMSADTFTSILDAGLPESMQLEPTQIAAASERFLGLQEHLLKNSDVIVDRFDSKTLSRALEVSKELNGAATYLAQHYQSISDAALAAKTDPSAYSLKSSSREPFTPPSNVERMRNPVVPEQITRQTSAFGEGVEMTTVVTTTSQIVTTTTTITQGSEEIDDELGVELVDDEFYTFEESSTDTRTRLERLTMESRAAVEAMSSTTAATTATVTSPLTTQKAEPALNAATAEESKGSWWSDGFHNFKRGMGHLYNRLRGGRGQQIETQPETEPAPQVPQNPPFERGSWDIMTDDSLARHQMNRGANVFSVNRVDRVWYEDGIGGTGEKQGFFKPDPPPGEHPPADAAGPLYSKQHGYRLGARAVLSSSLDKELGTNVIATEVFAEHHNPFTGAVETGSVSVKVDGEALRGGKKVTGEARQAALDELRARQEELLAPRYTTNGVVDQASLTKAVDSNMRSFASTELVEMPLKTDIDLRNPVTQEGLANLQVMDWLTGQMDRHSGNIFVDPDTGIVKGIDNDLAFASDQTPGFSNIGLPPLVPEKTAQAIELMDVAKLRQILQNSVPPSQRLTDEELSAATQRLSDLKEHIKKDNVRVAKFDRYTTFDRARAAGDKTYLGRHVNAVEKVASETRREYVTTGSAILVTTLEDSKFDVSKWASGRTAADETTTTETTSSGPSDSVWGLPPFDAIAESVEEGDESKESSAEEQAGNQGNEGAAKKPGDEGAKQDGGRGRGATYGGTTEKGKEGAPPADQRGRSRSEAGTPPTKEERKEGKGGQSGKGRKDSYARPIIAFGRDAEGTKQVIEEQKAERDAERLETVIKSQAPDVAQSGDAKESTAQNFRPSKSMADAVGSLLSELGGSLLQSLQQISDAFTFAGHDYFDDRGLIGRTPGDSDGLTSANRVDRNEYKETIGDSTSTTGYFKPEPTSDEYGNYNLSYALKSYLGYSEDQEVTSQPNLASRAVLSYSLDRYLGTNSLSAEIFASHTNRTTREIEFGNVSGQVTGRPLMETKESLARGAQKQAELGLDKAPGYVTKTYLTDFDATDAKIQKGFSDLQVVDWLTLQGDRHPGNIFVDAQNGKVTGIDNDRAFGARDKVGIQANLGMPPHVSRDTAEAVLKMSNQQLRDTLNKSAPAGQRLSEAELKAAESRLEIAKQHLGKEGVIVDVFDNATFDSTLEAKLGRGSGTYIGRHVERVKNALANGANESGPNENGRYDLTQVDNEKFDLKQWTTGGQTSDGMNAARGFGDDNSTKPRPSRTSDAARAFGSGMKTISQGFKTTSTTVVTTMDHALFVKEEWAANEQDGIPAGSRRIFRGWLAFQYIRERLASELKSFFQRFRSESTQTAGGVDKKGPWSILEDKQVQSFPKPQGDEPKANLNRVDRIEYKNNLPGTTTNVGWFKPEPTKAPNVGHTDNFSKTDENGQPVGPHLAGRAVLSSVLDAALKLNVLSKEVFAEHTNQQTGQIEFGNLSAGVDGKPLMGNKQVVIKQDKQNDMGLMTLDLNTAIDLKNAEVQKGLSNLQALDFITGQTDRHGGNIYVDDKGNIKGIDNDFSFSNSTDPTTVEDSKNVGLPPVLFRPTAEAIMNMSKESLAELLNSSVPANQRLTASEVKAAQDRLETLKKHIENNPTILVDSFNSETYDMLRQEKTAGKAQSYVASHANLVEAVQAGQVPKSKNDDWTYYIQIKLDDKDFDSSKWAPSGSASEWSGSKDDGSAANDQTTADAKKDEAKQQDKDRGAPVGSTISGSQPTQPGRDRSASSPAQLASQNGAASQQGTQDTTRTRTTTVSGTTSTSVQGQTRGASSETRPRASSEHSAGDRSFFTLKRSSHAGASPRTEINSRSANLQKAKRPKSARQSKKK